MQQSIKSKIRVDLQIHNGLLNGFPIQTGHLMSLSVQEDEIDEISMPTIILLTLILKLNLGSINFLQIYTEGFDMEIVNMALLLLIVPEFIYFEYLHLHAKVRINFHHEFAAKKCYSRVYDKRNTLAIHKSLLDW